MHDSVVDAIRKKSYTNISAEIYFNLKRGGNLYRRALKAVALLGAEVPAVAGLVPLHKMEFVTDGFEDLLAYTHPLAFADDPGSEVNRRVREYRVKHPEVKTYEAAMSAVLAADPELSENYAAGPWGQPVEYIPSQAEATVNPRAEAGMAIDALVRAILNANPGLNYDDMLRRVLQENPNLAQRYIGTAD